MGKAKYVMFIWRLSIVQLIHRNTLPDATGAHGIPKSSF